MNDIASYVERYRTFDEPVPYQGIEIYPIVTKDYYKFTSCIDVLKIEKNKIPNIQIIQMSYLAFLLNLMIESDEFRRCFIGICELCFHIEFNTKYENGKFEKGQILYHSLGDKEVYYINGYDVKIMQEGNSAILYIHDKPITSVEFDEIIDIIFYQNFPNYDNTEMSEDFKKLMEEYYRLKNKDVTPPTIEQQLIAIMGQNGMSKNQLKEETFYTVQSMIESIISNVDYVVQHIYRSQAVTDKKLPDIEHWVIKSNKDRYADMFTDVEEYTQNFEI